ncbi:hypothetical protein [Corallococcus sp. AB030]|uniref:hypothetical protein n=1 Tax=Corallococcus sp. AB030 TaxID=2316716 RepID=UPI0018F2E406|nr:hypothetical protein [Corallococcus sp. AB030]
MATPLRKKSNGNTYTRTPHIQTKLVELESLPRDELVVRARVANQEDPFYVPSECLLYFVRAGRDGALDASHRQLYRILLERIMRCLPKRDRVGSRDISFIATNIREQVLSEFSELLAIDRVAYTEKLDFYEVRFDSALRNLRLDAQKQAWREEQRSTVLEVDEETGEFDIEIECATGSFDPFSDMENASAMYRSLLDAAIDALPTNQRRVIEMIRLGFLIDSKQAGAVTISNTLEKSEKTIRNYRDRAMISLRSALSKGDEP